MVAMQEIIQKISGFSFTGAAKLSILSELI